MLTAAPAQARFCYKCGETKSVDNFTRNHQRRDGLSAECKSCRKAYDAAYSQENKGKIRRRHKAWRDSNPDSLRAYSKRTAERRPGMKRATLEARRAANPKLEWAKQACRNARMRAEKKGLPFDLDAAFVATLAPDKCPVLGLDLLYPAACSNVMGGWDDSPSIERRDSTKGYVRGNVCVISRKANTIKNNATLEEIRCLVKWMETVGC